LPEMVFEEGGQKMVRGKPQPFCKRMWKDSERTPPGPEGMIVIGASICHPLHPLTFLCVCNQLRFCYHAPSPFPLLLSTASVYLVCPLQTRTSK
jgi:hypothetical protein